MRQNGRNHAATIPLRDIPGVSSADVTVIVEIAEESLPEKRCTVEHLPDERRRSSDGNMLRNKELERFQFPVKLKAL